MALLSGNVGQVKLSTNTVLEMNKWTLNVGSNLQDTAAFGDTWEEKSPALLKWSGSFSGHAVDSDSTGQDALRTAALAGSTVSLRLYESGTKYFSGTAYIELSREADESSATQAASYNFTGTGALSYT